MASASPLRITDYRLRITGFLRPVSLVPRRSGLPSVTHTQRIHSIAGPRGGGTNPCLKPSSSSKPSETAHA
jgi:hypothetical protein